MLEEPKLTEGDYLVDEKCMGCAKVKDGLFLPYAYPKTKWLNDRKCPMATHLKPVEQKKEKALDPIKASKRKFKGI